MKFRLIVLLFISLQASAQYKEFGLEAGASVYFGDLNPYLNPNFVRPALGVFYRYNFSPYFASTTKANICQVGFMDNLSQNDYNAYRNLSFRAEIIEASTLFEFNFFKYKTGGGNKNRFSPFIYCGIGAMYFQNYTRYENKWIPARKLRTELVDYSPYQLFLPMGAGIKICIKKHFTLAINLMYHKLRTDYLDDVSKNYLTSSEQGTSINNIADPSNSAYRLSSVVNKQRGDQYKDKYIFLMVNLSYTIHRLGCPVTNNNALGF